MESSLSPREIQTRIRAGDSIDEVARVAGMTLEWVEPFAAPVLAEREFVAQQAQAHQVRRGGETIAHRSLGQVVTERLASRGVDTETVIWDSWRLEGRRWLVRVEYDSGRSHHEARFVYDGNGRFSVADNEDARWLLGLHSTSHGPQPGRRRREDDAEPTVDLNSDLALVRVVQPRADEVRRGDDGGYDGEVDDAYSEAELAEVNGIYDIVPNQTGGLDVLYDMLSSFDEDSVQIYAGLIRDEVRKTDPTVPESTVPESTVPESTVPEPTADPADRTAPAPAPMPTQLPRSRRPKHATGRRGREATASQVSTAAPRAASASSPSEQDAEAEQPALVEADAAAAVSSAPARPESDQASSRPSRPTPSGSVPEEQSSTTEPVSEEAPASAPDKPKGRRKRAEVPSWDEIMFGSPKNRG